MNCDVIAAAQYTVMQSRCHDIIVVDKFRLLLPLFNPCFVTEREDHLN
jgi:hypothetical protein